VQETITKVKPTLLCFPLPILILLVMLALLISPSKQVTSAANVTPEEAYEMISQQEVTVLDVRTEEEYDSGHIANAVLVPLSKLESQLGGQNKFQHILVYCDSDSCSVEAAGILIAHGFTHVYTLTGGLTEWQAQGFPTITITYTNVTVDEAYEMFNQQEVVIIDLRTQEDYESGHIPGALLIPLSELESRLGELNKADHILVYHTCDSCSKSGAQTLVDNGFLYVYHLPPAEFLKWKSQGLPMSYNLTG
jgi:rhodanese-related sulfurtransferase